MTPGDWWRPGGARPAFHQSRLALLQRIRGGSCRCDTMSAWSLTSCIRRGRALRCRHPLGIHDLCYLQSHDEFRVRCCVHRRYLTPPLPITPCL